MSNVRRHKVPIHELHRLHNSPLRRTHLRNRTTRSQNCHRAGSRCAPNDRTDFTLTDRARECHRKSRGAFRGSDARDGATPTEAVISVTESLVSTTIQNCTTATH